MARRVSWTNNSSNYLGSYVYRGQPLDPQNLPEPVGQVGPVAQGETGEWIDDEELAAGDYEYAVQDFDDLGIGELSAVEVYSASEDFSTAQVGDYIGGGVYAGIDTIDATDYHIISGDADSEDYGLEWKTSRTTTTGTDSDTDGLANTQAMETAGLADHPAAGYCLAYTGGGHNDWHMPARNQLLLIHANLAIPGHAEFADNVSSSELTWTSTEASDSGAFTRRLADSDVDQYSTTEGTSAKDTELRRVRPIRRVPV